MTDKGFNNFNEEQQPDIYNDEPLFFTISRDENGKAHFTYDKERIVDILWDSCHNQTKYYYHTNQQPIITDEYVETVEEYIRECDDIGFHNTSYNDALSKETLDIFRSLGEQMNSSPNDIDDKTSNKTDKAKSSTSHKVSTTNNSNKKYKVKSSTSHKSSTKNNNGNTFYGLSILLTTFTILSIIATIILSKFITQNIDDSLIVASVKFAMCIITTLSNTFITFKLMSKYFK